MATKAEKKLAKKLAKEQLAIQIQKDTLAREEALDQISLNKIKEKWFDTLIDTKVPQMQDNLRYILHYMEKLIEADNFRKLLFEDERQELEEEATLLAKSHGSALDTLFDIYQKRIQYLRDAYNEMLSEKKTKAEEEFNAIENEEITAQENMNLILFQMQESKDKKEENMNCDMSLKIDDEQSKNKELLESLQTKLEKKMESRWREITATLTQYEEATQARIKEYMKLKTRDDLDSKIIYQQMKKMQKLSEQLDELQKCNDGCYTLEVNIAPIDDLREERMKFFNTFKQLKHKITDELKEDENNIKILTVTTNQLTDSMKKTCSKGEQILTLYRICRKLETEYEKVVPTGNPLEIGKIEALTHRRKTFKAKKRKKGPVEHEEHDSLIKEIEILEKFWRKTSKVRLSILALEKCLESTEKKNQLLKRILASYLKEVATISPNFSL